MFKMNTIFLIKTITKILLLAVNLAVILGKLPESTARVINVINIALELIFH